MSEKYFIIIRKLSNEEFKQFLEKNGMIDFLNVLAKWEVTNGNTFLNLNELSLLKWGLLPKERKKLVSFLTLVKENPGKCLEYIDVSELSQIRHPKSIKSSKDNIDLSDLKKIIQRKLELPLKPTQENDPSEDYINMESPKSHIADCDEDGYLSPISVSSNEMNIIKVDINISNKQLLLPRPPSSLNLDSPPPLKYNLNSVTKYEEEHLIYEPIHGETASNVHIEVSQFNSPLQCFNNSSEMRCPTNVKNEVTSNVINTYTATTLTKLGNLFGFKKKNEKSENVETVNKTGDKNSGPSKFTENKNHEFNNMLGNFKKSSSIEQLSRPLPQVPMENCDEINTLPRRRKHNSQHTIQNSNENKSIPEYNKKLISTKIVSPKLRPLLDLPNSDLQEASFIKDDKQIENPMKQIRGQKAQNMSYEMFHGSLEFQRQLPKPPTVTNKLKPALPIPRNQDKDDYKEFGVNLNDNKFYRNTDRKGAKILLDGLEHGAFLFRPGRKISLAISINNNGEINNIGIERTPNRTFRLHTEEGVTPPEFDTLTDLIEHFSRTPLVYKYKNRLIEVQLVQTLPEDRY